MKINIGIPIDLLTLVRSKLLIQAGSGGGKSYVARKLAEEASGKVQIIIIDPDGEFATLREKYDFVLIGKDGDIPLNIRYAETLAHKLLETRMSGIIDLYEFKPHERIQFVKFFLEAMVNAPKKLWHSCMILIDEAHVFAPEDGRAESLIAVVDLCTRGRKRGYFPVLVTQRMAMISKNAIAQCQNRLIGYNGLDIDVERAGKELGFLKADYQKLKRLDPGEFFAYGPSISKEVVRFKVQPVKTKHPQSGEIITSLPPTPYTIKKIVSKLEDIPLEAEQEIKTKQDLQNKIREIEKENRQIKLQLTKQPVAEISQDKINQLTEKIKTQVSNELHKEYTKVINERDIEIKRLNKILETVSRTIGGNFKPVELSKPVQVIPKSFPKITPEQKIVSKSPLNVSSGSKNFTQNESNGTLPEGERTVLRCIAEYLEGVDREQISVNTGYKRSTRDAYILRLSQKSLCQVQGSIVLITDEGITALGNDYEPLPTGDELRQYWLNRLPGGEQKVFEMLINAYPESVSRESISEQTCYARSSRDAYIQRLMQRKLVKAPTKSVVIVSEKLYE